MISKLRHLVVLLAALGALCAFGGVAQAFTVTITPDTPLYSGGDGTGSWAARYHATTSGSTSDQWQSEAYSYLAVPDMGQDFRSRVGLDPGSDYTWLRSHGDPTYYVADVITNNPGACPYPGFHWFGVQVYWRWRVWVAALGRWSSWSSWAWTAVGPGVYGQACV